MQISNFYFPYGHDDDRMVPEHSSDDYDKVDSNKEASDEKDNLKLTRK